ncbi:MULTISPECIES: mycofactocin-coupled SDR family oxidoreductase [unclassified Frankia]|uniref:mycofactocin-coupled SDR family oxidoreductase n=1 Tax=unclassified Frankia TaxID=2632575 RepID=UPI002AD22559|nr:MULTISPECIES: mycofactocin-coupled SDR family oxidoreductase [unclassified Frankia]
MGKLDGRVALITGAARGQGRAHAVALAGEGADIIATDLCADIPVCDYPLATLEDLAETGRLVEKLGRRVVAHQVDVRDAPAMRAAVDSGVATLGRLDIVVANAAIAPIGADPRHDPDELWAATLDTNLTGVWNTLAPAIPHLVAGARGGAIVLTSSTAGLKGIVNGSVGATAYTASKHGVVGIMRALALELAPHSIRVNTVHPTGVNTPMIRNEHIERHLQQGPERGASMANPLPVPALEPEDIADAVLWLVSDAAKYVTGVALPVDAGFTAK